MKLKMMMAGSIVAAMSVMAETENVDGCTWSYQIDDGRATVFGGSDRVWDDEEERWVDSYTPAIPSHTSGAIRVPASLGGCPVAKIGAGAFTECGALTSVQIQPGVTDIGEDAFSDCTSLRSVVLPSGVTTIGGDAFDGCYSLSSIAIPDTVKEIGDHAFSDCKALTSIEIPASVTSIGYHAFSRCTGLKSVSVPETLKSMIKANEVFYKCSAKVKYYSKGGSGGAVPAAWKKARTLRGVAMRALENPIQGVFELKCGIANKKGVSKISATLTGLDGKKRSYKGKNADVTGETVTVNFDGLSVTVDGDTFYGDDGLDGGLSVESAKVGGNLPNGTMMFSVDIDALPESGDDWEIVEDDVPEEMTVKVTGGKKLDAGKAATLKYRRFREDGETWYDLDGLEDNKKPNVCALKITYTPKTGIFKGSFKIYATNEGSIDEGKPPKLKSFTVNFTGLFLDEGDGFYGIGEAVCKKPKAGPWSVSVE